MSRTLLPEGAGWRGIGRFLPRGPWGKAAAAALILAGLVSAGILGAGAFRGSSPPLAAVLARSGSATASTTTSAPMPTATWTSIPSPTPSLAPSSTPSPSLSPTPSFVWVTISSNARCRFGPARSFATAAFLAVGELVRAYGQDPTGEWWWVELPDGSAFCWVSDALVGLPMPPSIGAGTPGSPEPASPSPAASLPATSSAQP